MRRILVLFLWMYTGICTAQEFIDTTVAGEYYRDSLAFDGRNDAVEILSVSDSNTVILYGHSFDFEQAYYLHKGTWQKQGDTLHITYTHFQYSVTANKPENLQQNETYLFSITSSGPVLIPVEGRRYCKNCTP